MSDKQVQKAGDNSQQLQAEKVYIINGITEERVRAICSEVAVKAIADNSNESNELAMKRIDCFTELMLPRIQSICIALRCWLRIRRRWRVCWRSAVISNCLSTYISKSQAIAQAGSEIVT